MSNRYPPVQRKTEGLNCLVAINLILAGSHAGTEELSRFRREAEAIARLRHPHIIHIYEIGEMEGLPFLSLEFVEGGNLERRLARSDVL